MWNKIQKIYVGSNKVRPPLKKYTPTANTVSYLPMRVDTTTTDYWNAGWTWSLNGSGGSFVDNYYKQGSSSVLYMGYISYTTYSSYTIIFWCRCQPGGYRMFEGSNYNSWNNGNITIEHADANCKFRRYGGSSRDIVISSPTFADDWQWHMYAWVWSSWVFYVDWVSMWTNSNSVSFRPAEITMWGWRGGSYWPADYSDLIIEDRVWSATEILNHYNTYKENYWL